MLLHTTTFIQVAVIRLSSVIVFKRMSNVAMPYFLRESIC